MSAPKPQQKTALVNDAAINGSAIRAEGGVVKAVL
jgi:hypothetical protein